MKKEKPTWKRFSKPRHFLNKGGEHSVGSLTEIFQNFHLDDFRQEINLWLELALCNDQSAYDEGRTREDLLDFIQELHKLIEAFQVINNKKNGKKKTGKPKGIIPEINIPVLLTKEEKARPGLVIKQFCENFRQAYVKIEILDLLDAVITYKGNKKVSTDSLVLFYRHVHYLVKLAYSMSKKDLVKH